MNMYRKQRDDQQKRMSAFLRKHAFFAFDEKQFDKGLEALGLTRENTGSIVYIGGGGYVLGDHVEELKDLFKLSAQERAEALSDPETGPEFAYQMFYDELCNHEYSYTGDVYETLDALGYTFEEIKADRKLETALVKAMQDAGREE